MSNRALTKAFDRCLRCSPGAAAHCSLQNTVNSPPLAGRQCHNRAPDALSSWSGFPVSRSCHSFVLSGRTASSAQASLSSTSSSAPSTSGRDADGHTGPGGRALVIITGASRGLGAAIARQLLQSSYPGRFAQVDFMLVASKPGRLQAGAVQLLQQCKAAGSEAVLFNTLEPGPDNDAYTCTSGPSINQASPSQQQPQAHGHNGGSPGSMQPTPSASASPSSASSSSSSTASTAPSKGAVSLPHVRFALATMDLGNLSTLESSVRRLLSPASEGGCLPLPACSYDDVLFVQNAGTTGRLAPLQQLSLRDIQEAVRRARTAKDNIV